eukprot:CCRYP_011757-RC/>CCRYP_011757-RC protein AED:0.48 eAED:1.00 QI:0/0/0/1/0/0/2/0/105
MNDRSRSNVNILPNHRGEIPLNLGHRDIPDHGGRWRHEGGIGRDGRGNAVDSDESRGGDEFVSVFAYFEGGSEAVEGLSDGAGGVGGGEDKACADGRHGLVCARC